MFSVVIRVPTLMAAYPGGAEAYETNCPNGSFCSDGEVCRVGFMSWADVETLLGILRRFNLTPEAGAVAVIREDKGLLLASEWLEFRRIDGIPIGRLVDSKTEFLVSPPGWEPGMQRVPIIGADLQKWEPVEDRGGLTSYRDPSTGQVLHVGRAFVQGSERPKRPWWRFWS
jgi:hypothetical protein